MTDYSKNAGRRRSPGYTLMEVVVSLAAGSFLMAGLASCLFFAGRALDDDHQPLAKRLRAEEILADLTHDLSTALAFTERTSHAATFTVPDRNGDGLEETLRYAWSGQPGDPITYQFNQAPATVLAENVQDFDLSFLVRIVED